MPAISKSEKSFKKAVEAADRRPGRRAAGQDPVKRGQIIDGAKRVFMRVGFDAASMNDITREAGVSKGTIYVYFENKEELFGALIERERTAIFTSLAAILDAGTPLAETLFRYGTHLTERMTSTPVVQAQRMVIAVSDRMPELGRRFFDGGPDSAKLQLRSYFETQIAAGLLDIPDTVLAARQFFDLCTASLLRSAIFGVIKAPPPRDEIEATVAGAVDMFLARYGVGETHD